MYLHALRILPEKVQRYLHPCSENTRNANGGLAASRDSRRRYRPAQSIPDAPNLNNRSGRAQNL